MTAVLERPATRHSAPPRPVRARAVFAAAAALYLALGTVLVFGFDSIMEDALSRVSAASSVWSAVDPKLAAVGFVWTPLPALLMVPFTVLRPLWPALVSTGFAAVVISALSMAGAVAAVHGILADLRVRGTARWLVTALFALQPLILVYATNGMTEALLMLCLLVSARRLLRWLRAGEGTGRRAHDLVVAGIALGVGYLARYEAIVAAAAVTLLVVAVTWWRTRDRNAVLVDALLAGLPAAAAFVIWALLSWLTVGSPFEQFTSAYGNAALTGASRSGSLGDVAAQVLLLAPLALPLLVAACWRRPLAALAPVAVFGSVLVFEWLLRAAGDLFGFLRYQIMVIPLLAVVLALLLAEARPRRGLRTAGAALLAIVAFGGAAVTSGLLVLNGTTLASQEYLRIRPVVDSVLDRPTIAGANGMWAGDRALAARIDALDLPPGSVLADSGSAFAVLAASAHPQAFLITSDTGFDAALADPPAHGIRYVLRNEQGGIDAVRTTWPNLASTGWAQEIASIPAATPWSYSWTLWQVTPQTGR
ncbi:glycosyltransferase family 39 protein [Pseudonocardia ailaonensis]|uniref:Glycosyltransferase family 39 protein n=1 Tax=Pseudonocardia ailaonensis TaxID=367279 RepID=A0ABN2ND40_9PSEU